MHVLASQRSLTIVANPIQLPLTQLCLTWAFGHVGEYVQVVRTLFHNNPSTPSLETITTFWHFHPLAKVDLLPFVNDFHLEMNLVLDKKAFIYMLPCFPRLSFNNPSSMVYELLKDCFVLDNYGNDFDIFFEICGHIIRVNVLPLVSHLFVALQLVALEK